MATNRKFLLEGALHIYSSGPNVLRPCDLYKYESDQDIRRVLDLCNLYVVCRRKKISIDIYDLRLIEGHVLGYLLIHDGDRVTRERFSLKTEFQTPDGLFYATQVMAGDSHGHEIVLHNGHGTSITLPAHAVVAKSEHQIEQNVLDLEVLYIGQGIGRANNRLAIDRLRAHTKFQQILCEHVHEHPDGELLLLLFRYEHQRTTASTAGDFTAEPSASDIEELGHMKALTETKVTRRNRVALAEAALISHFRPRYNYVFKDSFPKPKAKLLRELCNQDLSGLIVEICTSDFRCRLKTNTCPARSLSDIFSKDQLDQMKISHGLRNTSVEANELVRDLTHTHIARIPLYTADERESFLHRLPWQ